MLIFVKISKEAFCIQASWLHDSLFAVEKCCFVYIPNIHAYYVIGEDQDVNLCSQELVLPDISTMHGRLFLGAWDAGLDSSADETAPLLVAAVEVSFILYFGRFV